MNHHSVADLMLPARSPDARCFPSGLTRMHLTPFLESQEVSFLSPPWGLMSVSLINPNSGSTYKVLRSSYKGNKQLAMSLKHTAAWTLTLHALTLPYAFKHTHNIQQKGKDATYLKGNNRDACCTAVANHEAMNFNIFLQVMLKNMQWEMETVSELIFLMFKNTPQVNVLQLVARSAFFHWKVQQAYIS